MTTKRMTVQRAVRYSLPSLHPPGLPSSAACSRRGSTTYIPVGVDSSLRWNDNGAVVIPAKACLHGDARLQGCEWQSGRREQAAEVVDRCPPAPCGRADKAGKDQALPGPLPGGIDSGVIGVIQLQHAQGVVREIIHCQHTVGLGHERQRARR